MSMEQFKYLHFDVKPNRRRLKDQEATLQFRSMGGTSYAITINQVVSNELRAKGYVFAKVRIDNFTQDAFIVFVKEEDNDTMNVRFSQSKENCNAQILGKSLIEWLCGWYGIDTTDGNVRKTINIGENLSRVEDAVVFKLNKSLIK